jgi:hypothetical protein
MECQSLFEKAWRRLFLEAAVCLEAAQFSQGTHPVVFHATVEFSKSGPLDVIQVARNVTPRIVFDVFLRTGNVG